MLLLRIGDADGDCAGFSGLVCCGPVSSGSRSSSAATGSSRSAKEHTLFLLFLCFDSEKVHDKQASFKYLYNIFFVLHTKKSQMFKSISIIYLNLTFYVEMLYIFIKWQMIDAPVFSSTIKCNGPEFQYSSVPTNSNSTIHSTVKHSLNSWV